MNPILWSLNGRRLRAGLAWLSLTCLVASSLAAKSTWTRISAEHFTLYTDDSVSEARDWAVALEAFRLHLQTIVPTDSRMLDPLLLVVFENPRTFKAVAGDLGKAGSLNEATSVFTSRDGRFLGAVSPEGEEENARTAIFLQASAWLTRSSRCALPVWLNSGLRMMYADHVFTNGQMLIGRVQDSSARSLEQGLRIPLIHLLRSSTRSQDYVANTGFFNAEAWAFVHFLLFGENGANRAALARYVEALQHTEDVATCEPLLYPQGLPDLEARFTRYVKTGNYRMEAIPVPLAPLAAGLEVAPATDDEIQTALGYLALAFRDTATAAPYFERMEQLAPKSPSTLEALAEFAKVRGDESEKVRYYQEAVRAGSTFYLAHFEANYPAVQAMFGCEAAADATDAAAARKGVDGIKAMLRLRPGFHEGYEAMAGLMGSVISANDDDEQVLQEGRRYFPDDAVLEAGQAAYEIHKRRFVDAQKRLDRVWGGALDNSGRAMRYTEKLKARLRAANGLYWMEKFTAADDYPNLEKLLPQLNGAPLRREEREHVTQVRRGLAAWTTLTMVREAMARKDWNAAEVLLSDIPREHLSKKLQAEADILASQIAAAKKPA